MITIDQFLIDIDNTAFSNWSNYFPGRDKRILNSLASQIKSGNFLTENQGKLLLKIFQENKHKLKEGWPNIEDMLANAIWSRPFRILEQVRRIFIEKDNTTYFFVEFTYNKRLKLLLTELGKKLHGAMPPVTNKIHSIPFTEKNIYLIISALKNQRFHIDQDLMKYYLEIENIIKNKDVLINESYNFFTPNKDLIFQDIGVPTLNEVLIKDRCIRFQYSSSLSKNPENLPEKVASRTNHKVWIDNTKYTLENILEIFDTLNRFPLLIIADSHDSKQMLENTKILHEIYGKDSLSVYFRYDNKNIQDQEFNQYVGESKQNQWLQNDTKIVMLAQNKLPKFLLKSSWYPKSVLSFTNSFNNTKSYAFCDAVDLKIFYTDKQLIMGTADAIV